MSSAHSIRATLRERPYALVYVLLVLAFLTRVAGFRDARTGFTSLELFGDRFEPRRLERLRDVPIHTLDHSDGYDGQFYAQMAVAGDPFDAELRTALDNPPYRILRVLLPAAAHVLGLGRPFWVLNAYALLGVALWLLLAWLLARTWFPPTDLHNLVRWGGTLFGAGMLMSVTHALTDGPVLAFLAAGMLALERGQDRLAAGLLAAAGLVRETSVLLGAAFLPPAAREERSFSRAALLAAVAVVPAAAWAVAVRAHYGASHAASNFGVPLAGLVEKVKEIHSVWSVMGYGATRMELLVVVALVTQIGYLLARPRLDSPWWRIGAAFSILALLVGPPAWEGSPGAISRVALPLTLAFNVLCPRTRAGLALLLIGNVSVLSAGKSLTPPPRPDTLFAEGIRCEYGDGWLTPLRSGTHTKRGAVGPATMRLHNPTGRTLAIALEFDIDANESRSVTLRAGDLERTIELTASRRSHVRFGPLSLPPGETAVDWVTPPPVGADAAPGSRFRAFFLRDLRIEIVGGASAG